MTPEGVFLFKKGRYAYVEALINIANLMADNLTLVIAGAATLVEIAPIKINPWSHIFKWIANAIVGDLKQEFAEFKKESEEKTADRMRWDILSFANSCRRGQEHSKDEWWHCISQIKEYEDYTKRKGIVNGVIEEDSEFLRELYHERNIKNDFLGGKKNELLNRE